MKFRNSPTTVLIAISLLFFQELIRNAVAQFTQGTSISYQGNLQDGGNPANGVYDFEFALFDAEMGGNQVSPVLELQDVPVVNGAFTVTLDFGPGAFTGDARWIETAVRAGADTGAFTILTPRRGITPVPYALHSISSLQIVRNFTVAPGQSVNAGDVVSLVNIGDERIMRGSGVRGIGPPVPAMNVHKIVDLTSSTLASISSGVAIGTVTGNIVNFGPATQIPGSGSGDAAALSPTQLVVETSSGGSASFVIADVSGNTVSFGPIAPYAAITNQLEIAALGPNRFVIAFSNGSDDGAAIADVTGNTISYGNFFSFYSGPSEVGGVASLSSTQFVIGYVTTASPPNVYYLVVGTLTGSTIAFGPPFALGGPLFNFIPISPGQLVLTINESPPTFAVAHVLGDTITLGPPYTSWIGGGGPMAALSPTQFVSDDTYPNFTNHGVVITLNGDAMNVTQEFVTPLSENLAVTALSPNQFVELGTGPGANPPTLICLAIMPVSIAPALGIAMTPASDGQRVPVILKGISNVHSGLIPGRVYYSDDNGTVQLQVQPVRVGLALSPTEILLEGGLSLAPPPAQ